MKLLYITNSRIPTEKAHGIQVMHMCAAFARMGIDVELLVPKRKNVIVGDPFSYYGVEKKFKITYVPCLDFVRFGRLGFILQAVTYTIGVVAHVLGSKQDVIYGRDEYALFGVSLFVQTPIFFEVHDGRWNFLISRVTSCAKRVFVITDGVKKALSSFGVAKSKMVIAPDGVDAASFILPISRESARYKLGIPVDAEVVLYAGHLYKWKGVDTLLSAASLLPADFITLIVGGLPGDVADYQAAYAGKPNIRFLGQQSYQSIPFYMRAADVVVLPNSGVEKISRFFTSPLKLFEYMASGTPLVASDLPSVREILDDSMCFFAAPDNPQSFANAIKSILFQRDVAQARADRAQTLARTHFSWDARAKKIIDELILVQHD